MRVLVACGLIAGLTLAHAVVVRAETVPGAPAAVVSISGFRSAHFGMTEAETRKAIEADFKLGGEQVRVEENKVQHTRLLRVTVGGLVPSSGKAELDYVLGYKSQRLIEVNVVWNATVDPANTAQALVQTGASLQAYFQNETFPPGQTTVNAMMPNGGVVLFRGSDPVGHTVAVILAGTVHQDPKAHTAQMTPTALTLAYAEAPTHPDVFMLPKGSF